MSDGVRSRIGFFEFTLALAFAAVGFAPEANAACGDISGQPVRQVFSNGTALATCLDGDNWTNIAGSGTPAGSTGHIQFNNAGVFAGDANLFWDDTNKRLGIGTVTPASPLNVVGRTYLENATAATENVWANPSLTVRDTRAYAASAGGGITFEGKYNAAGTYSTYGWVRGFKEVATDGDIQGGLMFATRSGPMIFKTQTSVGTLDDLTTGQSMIITDTGNVGIGTASPGGQLTIHTTANTVPQLVLSGATRDIAVPDGQIMQLGHWDGTSTFTERMQIAASGNVGIGTASPTQRLDVLGAVKVSSEVMLSNSQLVRFGSNNSAWLRGADTDGGGYIALGSNAEGLRLLANGNVGIGTSNPQAKLEVNGAIRSGAGQNFKIRYGTGSVTVNNGGGGGWLAVSGISYGHTFNSIPVVTVTGTTSGGFRDALIPSATNQTTSTFSLYLFNSSTSTATGTYTFNWTAIGD